MKQKSLVNLKDIFLIGLVIFFTIVGIVVFELYRISASERTRIDTNIPEVIVTEVDTKIFEALRKRIPPNETLPAFQTINETNLINGSDLFSSSMVGGSSSGSQRTPVAADPTSSLTSFPTPTDTILPLPTIFP